MCDHFVDEGARLRHVGHFFFSELISSFLTHFFIIQKAVVVVVVPKLSFMAAF